MLSHRASQDVANGPSILNPVPQCSELDSSSQRPVCQAEGFSIMRQQNVAPLISSLFATRCPSAISGFVISIIVDAVNRMLEARSWTHIGYEILERIFPSGTHSDSTAAVSGEVERIRIKAPSLHQAPNAVFRSFRSTMCALAVCGYPSVFAAARTCLAFFQMIDVDIFGITTIAKTRYMMAFLSKSDNNELSISLSDCLISLHGLVYSSAGCYTMQAGNGHTNGL